MLNIRNTWKAIGILLLAGCGVLPLTGIAQDKSYPTKDIVVVLPFAPGNAADTSTRLITRSLSELLGHQVIVENRPGAGGVGAVKQVAAAAPDGYTLLYVGVGSALSQSLFKPPPYDMVKSFVPISTTSSNDVLLLVSKDSKLKTLKDVIQEAKARGDRFTVGIPLLGTMQHLSAELFKSREDLDYAIVPFKSSGNLNTALRSGDIDIAFDFLPPTQSFIRAGSLKAIAIGNAERSPNLPEVPTFTELGVPDFKVASWGMFLAPANTPPEIVEYLNKNIQLALQDPAVSKRLGEIGTRIFGGTAKHASDFMASEIVRWGDVIRAAKIELR